MNLKKKEKKSGRQHWPTQEDGRSSLGPTKAKLTSRYLLWTASHLAPALSLGLDSEKAPPQAGQDPCSQLISRMLCRQGPDFPTTEGVNGPILGPLFL